MALLLAFVAVYVLTYNLIRPLREMSAATKRYARGDFSYRVDSQGSGEELAELAGALNSMAKRSRCSNPRAGASLQTYRMN